MENSIQPTRDVHGSCLAIDTVDGVNLTIPQDAQGCCNYPYWDLHRVVQDLLHPRYHCNPANPVLVNPLLWVGAGDDVEIQVLRSIAHQEPEQEAARP